MTGPDASSGEMPRVQMPGRVGRDQDDLLLDMILDRRPLPPDAPPGMHALASKLVGLAAMPGAGALPGEAAALAAFIRSGSPASTLTLAGVPRRVRRRGRVRAGRARLAAAVAVVAVGLSGTAAAAYAGVLPAPVQEFAHRTIGAPAAHTAAHHGDGTAQHRSSHPGPVSPSPHAGRPAHPAKPGKEKVHARPRHRGQQVKRQRNKKATHPVKPPHPTHSPRPAKRHPSPSPSPSPS